MDIIYFPFTYFIFDGRETGGTWCLAQDSFIAGKLFKTTKKVWKDGEEFSTQSADGKEVKMAFK
jgi:hypothetical protein